MDGRVPWPVRELLLGPVLTLSLLPLFVRYNSATLGYANPSSLYSFLWGEKYRPPEIILDSLRRSHGSTGHAPSRKD